MAINKKLIFWNNSSFNPPTSSTDTDPAKDVLWSSIVFFGSNSSYPGKIWTHGSYYPNFTSDLLTNFVTGDNVPITASDSILSAFEKVQGQLDAKAPSTAGLYYVIGNTSGTAGTWTGNISGVTSLYAGLTIVYYIGIAGASTTTLNINGLGAKTVLRDTSNLTTHLPVGTVVLLTYDGTYWKWADYYADTFDRTYWNNTITAGNIIYSYKLLMQGLDGKFYPLTLESGTGTTKTVSTQEFIINSPILFYALSTTVALNATTVSVYSEIPITVLNYTANQASWTSQQNIYLKGTILANGNFKLDNTSPTSFLTQTLPTAEDGFVYILLGYMYSTTAMRLFQYHPMYEFKDGSLKFYRTRHLHGNINDDGTIGSTSGLVVVTGTNGLVTASDKLTILDNGNVGIGTTSPQNPLEVIGDLSLTTASVSGDVGQNINFRTNTSGIRATIGGYRDASGSGGNLRLSTRDVNNVLQERIRIDSAGNVGIGVINSTYKLDVGGDINSWNVYAASALLGDNLSDLGVRIGFDSIGSEIGMTYLGTTDLIAGVNYEQTAYKFGGYNNNQGVSVNIASGNVGIGTTVPSFGSITGKGLEIEDTTNIPGIRIQGPTTGAFELYHNNGLSVIDSRIATGGSVIAFNTEGSEKMRITSSGNVGIGTTNPTASFEIYGVSQLTAALTDAGVRTGILALNGHSSSGGSGGTITFGNSQSVTANSIGGAAIKGILVDGANNTVQSIAFSTRNISTDTALTERVRINYNGYVGIGISNPSYKLDVAGGARFTSDILGTMFKSSYGTATYLNGNQGNALVSSTITAGGYVTLLRYPTTNGVVTVNGYQGNLLVGYTSNTTINASTNALDKQLVLINESGNSIFPGTITATSFINSTSNNNYVLLGGGGTKLLSDVVVSYVTSTSTTGTTNVVTTNTNTYLNLLQGNLVVTSEQIKGTGGILVSSDVNGTISIDGASFVDTTNNQTIAGTKTFSSTISGSINGSSNSVALHSNNEVNIGGSYTGDILYINYNDGGAFNNYSFYGGNTSLANIVANGATFSSSVSSAATISANRLTATDIAIGLSTPSTKLHVYQATALGSTVNNNSWITTITGNCGNNTIQKNLWLLRDATGSDWTTTRLHDAISVDSSFLTPGTDTRVWWERDPQNNIQSWGNSSSTYLTINSGSVGIGTTTPARTLEVNGYSLFDNNIFMIQNGGIFFSGNGSYGSGIFGRNSGLDLGFNTNSTEVMRITSTGKVGIGNTGPSYTLDVTGDGRFTSNLTALSFIGNASTSSKASQTIIGSCNTAQATAAKIVDLQNFVLDTGAKAIIRFNFGSVANATININNTGAKTLYYNGAVVDANTWGTGDIVEVQYDGTYYHILFVNKDLAVNKPMFGGDNSGNAATATTLQTARTISLGTGATSTATSFNGSANITIPVTGVSEAYLTWGGKNFADGYSPIDSIMNPLLGANRFAFMPPAGIVIEYSRDGGTTWVDYGANNATKINLFNGNNGPVQIGGGGYSAGTNYTNYQVRVIINTGAANVYTELNKFIMYISTNGSSGSWCSIDARLQSNYTGNIDTWVNFANQVSISGWSGYNVINTTKFRTYGNTPTSQYGQIRFTFGNTGYSTSSTGLTIYKIMGYGGYGWTTPSSMASWGQIYTYDYFQNVTFPGTITASQDIHAYGDVVSSVDVFSNRDIVATRYLNVGNDVTVTAGDINATGGNVTAQAFYALSDESVKTKIIPITSNDIPIKLYQFNWKKDNLKSYGFIAQELEKTNPELISLNEKTNLKSVNYEAALSLMLATVENRVTSAEYDISELNSLRQEVYELRNLVKKLLK